MTMKSFYIVVAIVAGVASWGCDSNKSPGITLPDSPDETYWNTLPTNYTVIAKQQVVQPVYSSMRFFSIANGYVTVDARRNRKVAVRTAGRIERLYVRYNYQYIHKGEKILDLYSPELNTYIEEYLFIQRNGNDTVLLSKAKQKLLLLGLSNAQITQLIKSGNVSAAVSIFSPYEGYVLFSPSTGNAMSTMSSPAPGMDNMSNTASNVSTEVPPLPDNSIREGMYLNKDQTIFWVNDFKQVLGLLAFNKSAERYVQKGQIAVVESELLPNQAFRSPIQLIEPVYEKGQHFTQARVYLDNPGGALKQNSLLTGKVVMDAKSLQIPQSSVQYLGKATIVWIKVNSSKDGGSVFQSRAVQLGRSSNGMIEVLAGLSKDDWIAKDAAYLTDSETIIKY